VRRNLIIAAVLLAALVVRLGEVARTTYTPINDAGSYLILASQVAHTGDYSTSNRPGSGSGGTRGPTALFPPAYPYFLAAIDLLDGHREDLKAAAGPARVSQAILGTVTVGLIGLIALEAFGAEAALVALVLAALYPVLIETSAVLLAENLLIALILAAVYCGLRVRRAAHPYRWIALAGVFTGLGALTHQNALLLLFPLAIAAWSSASSRASRTRALAVLALATALTIAPWTIRNAVELRSFIPISDQAGETLFGTYNPVSAADTRVPYKWLPPTGVTTAKALVAQAPSMREPDWESRLLSQALRYVRAHPLSPVSASFQNTLQLLEVNGSSAWEASAASIGLKRGAAEIGIVGFWLCALLALLGALTPSARRAPKWLWLVPILLALGTVWVRAETPRFRLPIDPFLVLLASLALTSALQRARARLRRAPAGRDARPPVPARDPQLVKMRHRLRISA
jgi:4-amino-4-deoxy-L-arabinose transferase-like glycosyltransferase